MCVFVPQLPGWLHSCISVQRQDSPAPGLCSWACWGLPMSLTAITDLWHVYGEAYVYWLQFGDVHGMPRAETGPRNQCRTWHFANLTEEWHPSLMPILQVFGKWSAAFRSPNPHSSLKCPLPLRHPFSPQTKEPWCLSPRITIAVQQASNRTRVWLLERVCPSSVVRADAVRGSFSTEFIYKQHTAPDCWWLSNSLAN